MNGFVKTIFLILLATGIASGADPAPIESVQADQDLPLTLDPASPFWRASQITFMEKDRLGKTVPAYRTAVRTRWTKDNLYFLFVCPYEQLHLKPEPATQIETNQLWNWDVAEVFLGSDFKDIQRYREFEISPQNEWIDLDIDLHKPHHEEGWVWNSKLEHVARVGDSKQSWYAALKMQFAALDTTTPAKGKTFRANLFRTEGPPDHGKEILWQP